MTYPRLVDFVVYGRELCESEDFGVKESSFGSFLGAPYSASSVDDAQQEMSRRLDLFAREQAKHNSGLYERHGHESQPVPVTEVDSRVLQFGFVFDGTESSEVLAQAAISGNHALWGEGFGVVTQAIIGKQDLSTIQMSESTLNAKLG